MERLCSRFVEETMINIDMFGSHIFFFHFCHFIIFINPNIHMALNTILHMDFIYCIRKCPNINLL